MFLGTTFASVSDAGATALDYKVQSDSALLVLPFNESHKSREVRIASQTSGLVLLPAYNCTLQMRLSFAIFLLASLVQTVFAASTPVVGLECGTAVSAEDQAKVETEFALLRQQDGAEAAAASQKTHTVPVYFHVVRKSTAISGGNVP